jgi:hypothetical protein
MVKEKVFAICLLDEDDQITNLKKLKIRFTKELQEDMRSFFALDIESEIAGLVHSEIVNNLTVDDIKDLLKNEK